MAQKPLVFISKLKLLFLTIKNHQNQLKHKYGDIVVVVFHLDMNEDDELVVLWWGRQRNKIAVGRICHSTWLSILIFHLLPPSISALMMLLMRLGDLKGFEAGHEDLVGQNRPSFGSRLNPLYDLSFNNEALCCTINSRLCVILKPYLP